MTRSLLADAFDHHVWATLVVLDQLAPLTDDQLATTIPGTYGTIVDTARHLVGADRWYLFTLTKGEVEEIEEGTMDIAALRAAMEPDGAALAGPPGVRTRPGRTIRPPGVRRGEPRDVGGATRPGDPSRDGPPEPALHRPHVTGDRAARDRRLGMGEDPRQVLVYRGARRRRRLVSGRRAGRRPASRLQYLRPRCLTRSKVAVSAIAMTAIVPAWTGSLTTRST